MLCSLAGRKNVFDNGFAPRARKIIGIVQWTRLGWVAVLMG